MRIRRVFVTLAFTLVTAGGFLTASVVGSGSPQEGGRQEQSSRDGKDSDAQKGKTKGSQAGNVFQQQGGRLKAGGSGSQGDQGQNKADTQIFSGKLIRPMVAAGDYGPSAPEEGSFTLRPGDVLELECAIPKNIHGNISFNVADKEILEMVPIGVRELVPVAMVGGQPRPITGMVRTMALFQAQKEGKTMIRLNLGLRQTQYHVTVEREQN